MRAAKKKRAAKRRPRACMYCGAPLCPVCRLGDCAHEERRQALVAALAAFPSVPGGDA